MMNKLMKKIAIAFTAATLTLTATSTAFAYDGMYVSFDMQNTYEVRSCTENDVNVRTEPSESAGIVCLLQKNQVVEIDGITDNGWVHLIGSGYVKAEFLEKTNAVPYSVNTNDTYNEEEDYKSMSRSDAIANVLDQALDSGLFTQGEIDDAVNSIMELQNKTCYTEGEMMSRDDAISGILNGMQQEMIDYGYLAY